MKPIQIENVLCGVMFRLAPGCRVGQSNHSIEALKEQMKFWNAVNALPLEFRAGTHEQPYSISSIFSFGLPPMACARAAAIKGSR